MFDRIGRRDNETPFAVEWLVRNGISVWSACEGEQRFDHHVDVSSAFPRQRPISRELLVSLLERVELTEDKQSIIKFRFREMEAIS